jgi:hypothetical protein
MYFSCLKFVKKLLRKYIIVKKNEPACIVYVKIILQEYLQIYKFNLFME